MPYKDVNVRKNKNKEYSRKDYLKNYAQRREQLNARRRELKKQWDAFKCTLKCTNCGFAHPGALDFHHQDKSTKEHSVNELISDGRFTKAYEEVKKCIVLCANCHRLHHWEEKQQIKKRRKKKSVKAP
jgi:hypothetical protein